jgi:hypothetical protein
MKPISIIQQLQNKTIDTKEKKRTTTPKPTYLENKLIRTLSNLSATGSLSRSSPPLLLPLSSNRSGNSTVASESFPSLSFSSPCRFLRCRPDRLAESSLPSSFLRRRCRLFSSSSLSRSRSLYLSLSGETSRDGPRGFKSNVTLFSGPTERLGLRGAASRPSVRALVGAR